MIRGVLGRKLGTLTLQGSSIFIHIECNTKGIRKSRQLICRFGVDIFGLHHRLGKRCFSRRRRGFVVSFSIDDQVVALSAFILLLAVSAVGE